jgi:hypothetical protein
MMGNFENRLRRLEKNAGDSVITAQTEDGQTISIKRSDLLQMTTAAFRSATRR